MPYFVVWCVPLHPKSIQGCKYIGCNEQDLWGRKKLKIELGAKFSTKMLDWQNFKSNFGAEKFKRKTSLVQIEI